MECSGDAKLSMKSIVGLFEAEVPEISYVKFDVCQVFLHFDEHQVFLHFDEHF